MRADAIRGGSCRGVGTAFCGSDYDLVGGVDVNPGDVTECEFTPVPGTRASEYACNPVFPGDDDERESAPHRSWAILYQMWYGRGFNEQHRTMDRLGGERDIRSSDSTSIPGTRTPSPTRCGIPSMPGT